MDKKGSSLCAWAMRAHGYGDTARERTTLLLLSGSRANRFLIVQGYYNVVIMSIICQPRLGLLLHKVSPFSVQKRTSVRESIHRYVEPEKFKKHMLAASQPYYKRKYILQSDSCKGIKPPLHELEPLQRIYANELFEAVKANDFVLFLQHNYTPFQSERVYKNTLIKSGGQFYSHRNVVYKDVFENLGINQVMSLFCSRNSLVLGKLDKLPNCVRALRRMPQFILLAGCIENEVYSYDQLQLFSDSPDLDMCRATLTSILETPAVELYQNLKQYVEMNSDSSSEQGESSTEQQDPALPDDGSNK